MIRVTCSTCGKQYKVADDAHGRTIRCKDCQTTMTVGAVTNALRSPPRVGEKKKRRPTSPTKPKSSKSSSKRPRKAKQDDGRTFRFFYTGLRIVRWTAVPLLTLLYYQVIYHLNHYITDEEGFIVPRPRGGGLIDFDGFVSFSAASMFALGLFGTLTFCPLVFAPYNWLTGTSDGEYWSQKSAVGTPRSFRIVVGIISCVSVALFAFALYGLVESERDTKPPLSWALQCTAPPTPDIVRRQIVEERRVQLAGDPAYADWQNYSDDVFTCRYPPRWTIVRDDTGSLPYYVLNNGTSQITIEPFYSYAFKLTVKSRLMSGREPNQLPREFMASIEEERLRGELPGIVVRCDVTVPGDAYEFQRFVGFTSGDCNHLFNLVILDETQKVAVLQTFDQLLAGDATVYSEPTKEEVARVIGYEPRP